MREPPRRKSFNSTLNAPTRPIAKVNKARQERREREGLVYGPIHDFVKSQPCVLVGNQHHRCGFFADRPRIESHHIKAVGAGGQDENNTVSVCPVLHDELESKPLSEVCRKYHIDFKSTAAELTLRFYQQLEA